MFEGLKKMFSKKAVELKQTAGKIQNKDVFEGTVWGGLYVAYNDGSCDADEIAAIEGVIASDDQFDLWLGELNGAIQKACLKFDQNVKLGRLQALRELADLKATPKDAELCLVCCISVAEKGGISEPEEKALGEIANALGLNLRNYL